MQQLGSGMPRAEEEMVRLPVQIDKWMQIQAPCRDTQSLRP